MARTIGTLGTAGELNSQRAKFDYFVKQPIKQQHDFAPDSDAARAMHREVSLR
jgi:hypothetical protein